MALQNFNVDLKVSVKETGSKRAYNIGSPPTEVETLKKYLDWVKNNLIRISKEALKEEQDKGFDKRPVVLVDGKSGKPIQDVSPLGRIEFISSQTAGTQIVLDAYSEIVTRSPRVTGTYLTGNFVLFNSKLIATNWSSLKTWSKTAVIKPGDVALLVNVMPYARRLERLGVSADRTKRKFVKSRDKRQRSGAMVLGANGTYFLAQRSILRSYKGNAKIAFGWISGGTLGISNAPVISKAGKKLRTTFANEKNKKGQGGPYIYPYIRIVMGAVK